MITRHKLGKELYNFKINDNTFVQKKDISEYIDNVYWLQSVKSFYDFSNLPPNPNIGDRHICLLTTGEFIRNHIYECVNINDKMKWINTNELNDAVILYIYDYNFIYDGKLKNILIYSESNNEWSPLYDNQEVEIDINDLKADVAIINNDLNNIHSNISNIDSSITTINNDVSNLENTVININLDITDIKSNIFSVENDLNDLSSQVNNNTTNINNLSSQVNNDIADINANINNLSSQVNNDITNINANINNLLSQVNNDITDINANINNLSSQVNNDITNINANINNLSSQVNNDITDINANINNLSSQVNNDITDINANINNLSSQVNSNTTNINNLSSQVNNNTDEITDINTNLNTINNNLPNYVTKTDNSILNFTNASNNFQTGSLTFGANSLNNVLINSSVNSTLNTDIITAGYLSNRGVNSTVSRTDTNALNFSNTSNNIQAGTLKIGSNSLNNILINSSANSTLNTDIITAGYLSNKGTDSMVRRTDSNALNFTSALNNFQAGSLTFGSNSLNNVLISSSANSTANTDVVTAGYLSNRGVNSMVKQTDTNALNFSNTSNNFQVGTLKIGSNSLNNVLINSSANSILDTDIITAGYLSNKGTDSMVRRTDSNTLNFSSTSNNIQAGTLKLGTNTSNSLNNILINTSSNSTTNTDVVTAGYLSNRGVNSTVTRTDTNALTFSSTSNNIQAGTLKLGTNTSNSLNNILIGTSGNSTANTDVVTAGYLSNRDVNSAVTRTDTNALTFSNTSNNIQAGTLKLGTNTSNSLNNILTNSSANSILNTDVVTAGYLSNRGVNSTVTRTDTNALNFSNTSNNFQVSTLKIGSNSLNNILINSSANSTLNTDIITAGYLSNKGVDSMVRRTDSNTLNFSNTLNNIQAGTLKIGSNSLNNILISSSANSTLNTDIVTAGYLSNKGVESMVRRTDTNTLNFSNTSNNFQAGILKLGSNTSNFLNNILTSLSELSVSDNDVITAGYFNKFSQSQNLKLQKLNFINESSINRISSTMVKINNGITDYILVSGESDIVEVYQINNNKLMRLSDIQINGYYSDMSSIFYRDNNNICHGLFVGGVVNNQYSNYINDYAIINKTIKYTPRQLLQLPRSQVGSLKIVENDKEYLLFGGGYNGNCVNNVDVCVSDVHLSPNKFTTSFLTNKLQATSSTTIVDNNGVCHVLVAGGVNNNTSYNTIDMFKMENNVLVKLNNVVNLDNACYGCASVTITDNNGIQYAIFAGGRNGSVYYNTVNVYKIVDSNLIKITNSSPLTNACHYISCTTIKDNIGIQYAIFAGGTAGTTYYTTIDIYKIENGVLSKIDNSVTLENPCTNRSLLTITNNNDIQFAIFAGGNNNSGNIYDTMDIYKIENNSGVISLIKIPNSVTITNPTTGCSSTIITDNEGIQYALIVGGYSNISNNVVIDIFKMEDETLIKISNSTSLTFGSYLQQSLTIKDNNDIEYALFVNSPSDVIYTNLIDVYKIKNEQGNIKLIKLNNLITLSNFCVEQSSVVIKDNNGIQYALFNGGYNGGSYYYDTIDIFKLENEKIVNNLFISPGERYYHTSTTIICNNSFQYALFGGGTSYNSVYDTIDIYKIQQGQLVKIPNSETLINTRYDLSSATIKNNNGKQYALFAGGYGGGIYTDIIDIYKIENEFMTKINNNDVRLTHICKNSSSAVITDNNGTQYALFAGGYNGVVYLNIIDIYKMENEQLIKLNNSKTLTNACSKVSSAVITDNNNVQYVLFAGGLLNYGRSNTIDVYKIIDGILIKHPTSVSLSHSCIVTSSATIISSNKTQYAIFTGCSVSETQYKNTIDIYKIINGVLIKINNFVTLSSGRAYTSAATIMDENNNQYVIVTGGGYGNWENVIEIFKMENETLIKLPNSVTLPYTVGQHLSAVLTDNNVQYAIFNGGSNSTNYNLTIAYTITDFLHNAFQSTLSQPTRKTITATLSDQNGKQYGLFAGGITNSGYSDLIDIFTINNNEIITIPNNVKLSQSKSGFASVIINDNNGDQYAIFAGGYNGSYLNEIDIYKIIDNTLVKINNTITLNIPRSDLGSKMITCNGKQYALFIGGHNSSIINTIDIFTISDGILINIPNNIYLSTGSNNNISVELLYDKIDYIICTYDNKIESFSFNI